VKNAAKLIGIFALVLLLGFCFWACEEPKSETISNELPALTGTVSIEGVTQVGQTLSINTSDLGGNGDITYKWNKENKNGENNDTYVIQASDVGSTITVTVTRSGYSGSVTSAPTDIITVHTPGLAYTLINNTAYSVSKGTATSSVVIIPSVHNGLPVVAITDSGFTSYANMTSIIIPNGVTRIGNYAFFNCYNLTSIVIPAGVTNIGNFAFDGCSSLATIYYSGASGSNWAGIVIGSSNTSLINANRYFYSETHPSTANTHWRFGRNIPEIWGTYGLGFSLINNGTEYSVYESTVTDNEVFIPATYEGLPVTSIRSDAFRGCTGLTSITIPNSVTSIDVRAFYDCTGLTSITIPNSVTGIGQEAFSGCTGLTSITIGNGVTSIGQTAFSGCTGLTSITIGNSVTSIGQSAFRGCTGLTSITIPNSVTSIRSDAFYGCTGLTSITIGNGVTSIGNYAFYGCTSLTSITIPNSVTSIDRSAFYGCKNFNIIVASGNSFFTSQNGILYNKTMTQIIFASVINGSFTIPNSVTSIGDFAFDSCIGLTSITIPNSVTSIGDFAFTGCIGLTSVTFMGNILEVNFSSSVFGESYYNTYNGDLRAKYLAGGIGTYTRQAGSMTWTKQ